MKVLAFWFLFFLLFGVDVSMAQCACHPETPTARSEFARSDVIFVGKVIKSEKVMSKKNSSDGVNVEFQVRQVWKRDLARFVLVKVRFKSKMLFEENVDWLVYATLQQDGSLSTVVHCCTRTKPLSVVADDLTYFKTTGEKKKKIIEKEAKK